MGPILDSRVLACSRTLMWPMCGQRVSAGGSQKRGLTRGSPSGVRCHGQFAAWRSNPDAT